ncbi:MAG TPA: CsbD family protein [Usitatibacter sp.]|nr:CsbD family protein [Usitatibacter sp.]
MDSEQMHGYWREMKGVVLERWGHVTRNPWLRIAGRRERIFGQLEVSLARSRRMALASFPAHRDGAAR